MIWKCLIVDDELIARKLLSEYVTKIPELELVGTCPNALEAMNKLEKEKIDILFLDIQMPDLTGLDFLKVLPYKLLTILTTAYSEFAVQSYELDVTDYLLKPIEFDRFYKSVTKVISASDKTVSSAPSSEKTAQPNKLFLKANNKIIKISFEEIAVINSQGAYIQVITTDNRKIMSLQSMSKMEESLPDNFYRTHRSHIVNIDHIDSIEGNMIRLGEYSITLSKNKKEEFIQMIDGAHFL
ncbi:MAG: response regulator [Cytophagales bacterium]|nr:response regulator [Cytophagales bacterium]